MLAGLARNQRRIIRNRPAQVTPRRLTTLIKTMDIKDLFPAKTPVETSIGTAYVRNAYSSDWKHLKSDESQAVGRAGIQYLSSFSQDNDDQDDIVPLTDEEYGQLNEADLQALAVAISKQNGWGDIRTDAALDDLGQAIQKANKRRVDAHKKMLTDMRESINSKYGFLEKGPLQKLQDQMAGLGAINAMSGTQALQDAMKALRPGAAFAEAISGTTAFKNAIKPILPRHLETNHMRREPVETPRQYFPPQPEETTLGRAAIESAKNSKEAALKLEMLVGLMAGLHQTIIIDVLPAWKEQIEAGQRGARHAFEQTANGLMWTKWAVMASVVVAALTTTWQVHVAKQIDRESTEQQTRHEVLLGKLLEAQQKIFEQQAEDQAALRIAIYSRPPSAQVPEPKK